MGQTYSKRHFKTLENRSVYVPYVIGILFSYATIRMGSQECKAHVIWQLFC